MDGYYGRSLSGERLDRCYAIASPRVKQYLEAEIDSVRSRIRPADAVLELGCGTGRVAGRLAEGGARVTGIDTAAESISVAKRDHPDCEFFEMDALSLGFPDAAFDLVACVQNGICAFHADPDLLLREALRVTRPGGRVLFSTYTAEFWPERLGWFHAQADAGLLGPIDIERTGNGIIVCSDGFRSGTFTLDAFENLCRRSGVAGALTVVDGSSLFCEVIAPGEGRVVLRPVLDADLPVFFEQQLDEAARYMAAFTTEDPADRGAFDTHWRRIRSDPAIALWTIVFEARVAGYVASFVRHGLREISYWLGRGFWSRGLATEAASLLVAILPERPLHARAAKDNLASLRVLEKCGFTVHAQERGFAAARGTHIDELLLRLEEKG